MTYSCQLDLKVSPDRAMRCKRRRTNSEMSSLEHISTRCRADLTARSPEGKDAAPSRGRTSEAGDIRRVLPDWTISSGSEQDIEQLLRLWQAAGSRPSVSDTHEGLQILLGFDPDALLVAKAGDVLIGSLIAAWDGWRASFYRLAVDSHRRGEGIATALLREGEHRLRARGAIRFTAIVTANDPTAIGFWLAAGYDREHDRTRFVRHAEP